MKIYDTIIVGGGIAGMGCAKTLKDNGHNDFLLITKDIGGRITTPKTGHVNYGAYYCRSDYHYIKEFVQFTRPLAIHAASYVTTYKNWKVWHIICKHPIAMIRMMLLLFKVSKQYQHFKKRSEEIGQTEALKENKLIYELYNSPAEEYLKKKGLGCIIEHFVNPCVLTTCFLDVSEVNAFAAIACLFIIIHPSQEFEFVPEKLIETFFEHIQEDEVTSVAHENGHYRIKTKSGKTHHAKHLVMAAPIHITKELLHAHWDTNDMISVHMAHVRGEFHHSYEQGEYIILSARGDDVTIAHQYNETYIFYSRTKDYDLDKYFKRYEIIHKKYWHPAGYIGTTLIDMHPEENLYVIGDNNFFGMEDTYITGRYAANQILKRTK